MKTEQGLEANRNTYESLYQQQQAFLRYPADWLIRFYSIYLKKNRPKGRVLDYACGSGNNSAFFIEQGYETWGLEVAPSALPLVRANFESRHFDPALVERFSIVQPGVARLPFDDSFFDVIFCNEAIHLNPSAEVIRGVCREFTRCLRPGGVVAISMMGPACVYISRYGRPTGEPNVYQVQVSDPEHKLQGIRELLDPLLFYIVPNEEELRRLFDMFECLSVGHVDQGLFDLRSTFHWLFFGRKPLPRGVASQ